MDKLKFYDDQLKNWMFAGNFPTIKNREFKKVVIYLNGNLFQTNSKISVFESTKKALTALKQSDFGWNIKDDYVSEKMVEKFGKEYNKIMYDENSGCIEYKEKLSKEAAKYLNGIIDDLIELKILEFKMI